MEKVEAAQVEKEAEIIQKAEAEDDLDMIAVDVPDPVDIPVDDEGEDTSPVDEDPVDIGSRR